MNIQNISKTNPVVLFKNYHAYSTAIQFWLYLPRVSVRFHRCKATVPQKIVLIWDANHKFGGGPQAVNPEEFLQPHSALRIHEKWLNKTQERGILMMIVLLDRIQIRISQMKKMHSVKSGRVSEVELPCPLPWNQGVSFCQHIDMCTNKGAYPSHGIQSFYWSFIV